MDSSCLNLRLTLTSIQRLRNCPGDRRRLLRRENPPHFLHLLLVVVVATSGLPAPVFALLCCWCKRKTYTRLAVHKHLTTKQQPGKVRDFSLTPYTFFSPTFPSYFSCRRPVHMRFPYCCHYVICWKLQPLLFERGARGTSARKASKKATSDFAAPSDGFQGPKCRRKWEGRGLNGMQV